MNLESSTSEPPAATSYDELPYPNLSYAQTHPDRLATLGRLLGLDTAPVDGCRVLELGCAGGGNLIPMAYALPDSSFVGVDYAASQIAGGQQAVEELGLANLQLYHIDIANVPADFGQFDYIIAHGVYSWVPAPVRDKLLAACRSHLAPQGVAYVSYNTYPAWHLMGVVRGMMRYHTRNTADPLAQSAEARELLNFMTEAIPADSGAYGSFLHHYKSQLLDKMSEGQSRGDALLVHDELEDVNEPVYFYQFAEHAAQHGLQYLVEAKFSSVMPTKFPPEVGQKLQQMASDIVQMEQYLDFLNNRGFRRTLLCHQERDVVRTIHPDRLKELSFASRARPEAPEPDLSPGAAEKFLGLDGSVLTMDHPLTKAAMIYLNEVSPQAVPFDALVVAASETVAPISADDPDALATNMLRAYSYSSRLAELHVFQPPFTITPGERPLASLVARFQARRGEKVTNLRHERIDLHDSGRFLLPYLDGQHTRDDLLQLLTDLNAKGAIRLRKGEETAADQMSVEELLADEVDQNLRFFARAALLMA